jgi:hypothetical protein
MTTAMTITRHVLPGLRPEPLASYLAGLGLIRVLGEQAAPPRLRRPPTGQGSPAARRRAPLRYSFRGGGMPRLSAIAKANP